MSTLVLRISGVAIILVCMLIYRNVDAVLLRDLVVPIAMGLGTWLTIRNLTAVCVGAGLLALIHSDGGGNWIEAMAYPILGSAFLAGAGFIYLQRFRKRIADTHEARWQSRRHHDER
ncbi:MAG: hypothetical protein QF515_14640 [Pseudomonadales bacterium]|jgi:hypothetical protein|nr:hypothetical protein [Pseudomonadales bacterium]MDP6828329.1 hypothetical protein [Pseudomonadales bacterium]|tara:strand:+ start:296 stop:646 length:351 start_codon:yes stop_codon:yes gene_type:complete